jgi:hypothetical protein
MSVYLLKEHQNSGELHIFEATPNDPGCTPFANSRCGNIPKNNTLKSITNCLSASAMRRRCAEIGAQVCGQCVGTLYAPFDGEE